MNRLMWPPVKKFAALAKDIEKTSGVTLTIESIASGFLKIAVENMANAIKKISVQRGYDVTDYALQCFGGAGGQHACLIADVLGMTTVLIHPLLGCYQLMVWGLLMLRRCVKNSIELAPEGAVLDRLHSEFDQLAADTQAELRQQDIAADRIETHLFVHLRYEGSDTALPVPFGSLAEMKSAYDKAYQSRFGFLMTGKGLIAALVSVESIGHTFQLKSDQISATPEAPTSR